ncbi:MAG: HEPN domain-containing protein [Euryarchaeota archaeon]
MDEKKILINNAHEKLEAAKNLFENGFYNDSVSRAYYAMFFSAKALLFKKNIHPKTHRGLISQFGLEFVNKNEFKKELFDLLARAQEDIEEADYGLFSSIDQNEAKIIIEGAESFLNECELNL